MRALVDGAPCPWWRTSISTTGWPYQAVENGIAKVRINPGNLGGEARVRELATAENAPCAVRIGVNTGSLEKWVLEQYGRHAPRHGGKRAGARAAGWRIAGSTIL